MKKHVPFILVLLIQFGFSQEIDIEKLTLDDYLSDLETLDKTIEAQHPNPYKYVSKELQLKNKKNAIKRLKKEPSYHHFIQALNRFGDGHLSYTPPEDFIDYTIMNDIFFPFPVLVRGGKMFINYKNTTLPFGTEITAIEKIATKEIIDKLHYYIHGDGYIKTNTETNISSDFPFYYSNYIQKNVTSFSIEYKNINTGSLKTIQVPAVDYYELYRRAFQAMHPINKLEQYKTIHGHYLPDSKTGILTVNSFNINEAYAYKEFSKFFKKMNADQYKTVIIDIRNNPGGNPNIAALLFSFITDTNFKNLFNYKTSTIKLYSENLIDENGAPVGYEGIKNFENFLYQRFDKKDSIYIGNDRLKEGILENFPPDKDNFKGTVYTTIGGNTFSAAVYFAKLFKDHKRGSIVGIETGGNENTTFAGWFMNYKLPKTKLRVRIPITELYFGDVIDTPHGIIPDHIVPVDQYMKYLLEEKDPELQFILDREHK
ncbi:hypothetical protein HN014_13990 [Aquimarina sp. TRL1]|uniref:S41 family peptidase n=1 Tax=Aquimarina sp. (strain TRL1) TaxID=2736252 RepID=UPI00158B6956|nr:S41 family peptidase [Aquimarina sp. TRL1]QKX05970.1 hypothetical protein HN014_13990 [Aquimarina sp. TRL1]